MGYEAILYDTQEQHIRITYDQGTMALMTSLPLRHQRLKVLVDRIIGITAMESNIPICSLGQTTWRRRELLKGLEADECYYVQHELQVRSLDDLNLAKDPPPDLVLEVDITHHPIDRMPIYAALGVPEVWMFYVDQLLPLKLDSGNYVPIEFSLAFPFLKPRELERFLAMRSTIDETTLMRSFRDWIKTVPVVRNPPASAYTA